MFSHPLRLREILSSTVTELTKNRGLRGTNIPESSVRYEVNSGWAPVQESRALIRTIVPARPAARTQGIMKVLPSVRAWIRFRFSNLKTGIRI